MPDATIEGVLAAVAIPLLLLIVVIVMIKKGVQIVPQSMAYVIERFGKYTRTLPAGLNAIVPFLDQVAHRISILERQLPPFAISVITKDNVEVDLQATVFFRIIEAEKSVYRIQEVNDALPMAATAIVRSAGGKLELDDLQSSRDAMNQEIAVNLQQAAETWGLEITRTEIIDVIIDEETKAAQRQQLNAERERRALIAKAEGEKRAIELAAEAALYQAEKEAQAIRVTADGQLLALPLGLAALLLAGLLELQTRDLTPTSLHVETWAQVLVSYAGLALASVGLLRWTVTVKDKNKAGKDVNIY